MKAITKLTLALVMGFFAIGFQSCGSDDKDEPEEPFQTTIDFSKPNAIVGHWSQTETIWEDGSVSKSTDRSMQFNSDGTFEFRWGTDGFFSAKGTYEYNPQSKDKGVAKGRTSSAEYTFTFENYTDYRYKVTIEQPEPYLGGIRTTVCIFGNY